MHSSDYCNESVSILSRCTVVPDSKSSIEFIKLSVSDLPMLTFQYIIKGCLFSGKPSNVDDNESLISFLKLSLSKTLSVYPPLAGHLSTDSVTGYISVICSDAGALFIHARASYLLAGILDPSSQQVFRRFFALDDILSYDGHSNPIVAVQVTELVDGVFIGCSVNHAVVDGTSFWNFFNTFAEISRGETKISRPPCFSRDDDNVFHRDVVLRGPPPTMSFSDEEPIRERIFHFSRTSVLAVKKRANESLTAINGCESTAEISSFQALSAQLWRSVTRARNLPPTKTTTFIMPVNCRRRVEPNMNPFYFGNAIQIIKMESLVGELLSRDIEWSADLLRRNVGTHDDLTVRTRVEEWMKNPQCFPLGNFDGATVVIGSSPRFPMYDNDFGWGPPVAVRSGKANRFDGCFSTFPGREGNGSVELEAVLAPETMAGLENDLEFIQYIS